MSVETGMVYDPDGPHIDRLLFMLGGEYEVDMDGILVPVAGSGEIYEPGDWVEFPAGAAS